MLRAYVDTIFLFVRYFFLCRVCIVGMEARVEEGGALLRGVVIGNVKFLDSLDLS